MENIIDLHDVQGNIMHNYVEYGYYNSRYLFLEINEADSGRAFVKAMRPFITSAAFNTGDSEIIPESLTNIAFTYNGLKELGIPTLTLQGFPDEFVVGIRNRTSILGDNNQSSPEHWDKVYREDIHVFISIDALNKDSLEKRYLEIKNLIKSHAGVELLDGCKKSNNEEVPYQDASVLYDDHGLPTAKEHFGYTDGISNPYFKGMTEEMGELLGGGKRIGYSDPKLKESWDPIETGEFILGYRDEANEYPAAPLPKLFSNNGAFLTFNKFHENVGDFNNYLNQASDKYQIDKELLAAKFVGRWRNGAPMTTYPTKEAADQVALERQKALFAINQAKTKEEKEKAQLAFREINKKFTAFDYSYPDKDGKNDITGSRCPVGAHMRRANPRGALEMGNNEAYETPSALANRRRLIRRGLPYGTSTADSNEGEHGTIIMTVVANIKRQFEFVVQQWLNYSNDFRLANDKDPIFGNQDSKGGRMVIEGNEDQPAKFLMDIPRFIETRGGVYLFMPSITSLNLIERGIVDPT